MSIFFPEPDIKIGEVGFKGNCDLGRKESGVKLSDLIEKIHEPVVIAVDGLWGSGKSHFLKLWAGAHTLENKGDAEVIYFDAFKHDYFDDPLVALVGEIANRFSGGEVKTGKIANVLKYGGRLVKPISRIGLAAATGFVSEALGATAKAATEAMGKEANDALDPVWENENSRREAMEGFKQALTELTIEKGTEEVPKKIVIIVGELDRCRPDFALNTLEIIKHFFAVQNVIFVLGVNLEELENSVRARYGNKANAAKYLQKFIQVRFRLEDVTRLSDQAHVNIDYFNIQAKKNNSFDNEYVSYLQYQIKRPSVFRQLSLREVQQLLTLSALAPVYEWDGFMPQWAQIGQMQTITGLMILKVTRPDLLAKARNGSLSFSDINSVFQISLSSEGINSRQDEMLFDVWNLVTDKSYQPRYLAAGQSGAQLFSLKMWEAPHQDFLPLLIANYLDRMRTYK